MGILGKLFNRGKPAASAAAEAPPCPHTTLVPRWDSVADMGREEKITGYACQGCNQSFSAAEGRELQRTEAARVQRELTG